MVSVPHIVNCIVRSETLYKGLCDIENRYLQPILHCGVDIAHIRTNVTRSIYIEFSLIYEVIVLVAGCVITWRKSLVLTLITVPIDFL